ncbi:glycoside hydrolase family 47 protein [Lysobacter sp. TY2-98]|uniref:glycoside hydrolase family 47 protein n=1 Tax=Lysobacter sp. TY2-98 TaxID=2290922 RepID=UPI0019636BC4|nr:glycoside hydrolase family 47 protein [Lysobacter sp. TY2-98]
MIERPRKLAPVFADELLTTRKQADEMESFVLAETFKYFYLLFAPLARWIWTGWC